MSLEAPMTANLYLAKRKKEELAKLAAAEARLKAASKPGEVHPWHHWARLEEDED